MARPRVTILYVPVPPGKLLTALGFADGPNQRGYLVWAVTGGSTGFSFNRAVRSRRVGRKQIRRLVKASSGSFFLVWFNQQSTTWYYEQVDGFSPAVFG